MSRCPFLTVRFTRLETKACAAGRTVNRRGWKSYSVSKSEKKCRPPVPYPVSVPLAKKHGEVSDVFWHHISTLSNRSARVKTGFILANGVLKIK